MGTEPLMCRNIFKNGGLVVLTISSRVFDISFITCKCMRELAGVEPTAVINASC